MSGPSLITADAGAYSALGDGGEPVWRRAAQVRAAIDTRLGKRHADLFAIPQEHAGRLDWRAPFDGVPRRYADLTVAEKLALQAQVQELRPDLERLVDRLDAAGRSDGERAFGRLLRLALTAPGPDALFSVDGKPVLTFWGFTGANSPGSLLGLAAAPAATAPGWTAASAPPVPPQATGWTPVPSPGAPPSAGWQTAPVAGAAAPPPGWNATQAAPGMPQHAAPPPPVAMPAAVAPADASSWAKGLLIAAFLLLLLAVAAYFVKPYLPRWVWDGKFTLPSTAGTTPGGSSGVDDAALRAEQAREAALRTDHARLFAQFNDRRNQCAPGRQGEVVPGGTVVVPGTDGTTTAPGTRSEDGKSADATRAPGAPMPRADDPTKPSTEARRPPDTKPDGKAPQAGQKPPADSKAEPKAAQPKPPQQAARPTEPRTGPTPGEKPIQPVRIPPEPGVRFMQGEWRSSTDLTTQGGEEVVRPQYSFDKDGKGRTKIVQKNGVVCEGPAEASRGPGGKLVIRETEALKCSDGTTYAPSTVTCDPGRDGQAQCQGNSEGGPTYAVQLGK